MSNVAVQLLTYNGEQYLAALFESLARQRFTHFELFVLDNGSTDASASYAARECALFPRPAHFEKNETNVGFAAGHNTLFGRHRADYILCVNQDTVLEPNYLAELVQYLDAHPTIGSCAGKLVTRAQSGPVIDSAGLRLHWYGAVTDIGQGERDRGQYNGVSEVFGVSGALPLYRRAAVAAASDGSIFFDEQFFSYKEDADLAWRMHRRGFGAAVLGYAVAQHMRSVGIKETTPRVFGQRLTTHPVGRQRLSVRNHLLMLVKNVSGHQWWHVSVFFCYEVAKCLYLLVCQPRALAGYVDFFRLLPDCLKKRKVLQSKIF